MRTPYAARRDHEGVPFVAGPDSGSGSAFSYYGGTLDPQSRFENLGNAEQAARLCNMAFSAGYAAAMAEMRDLINRTEAPE